MKRVLISSIAFAGIVLRWLWFAPAKASLGAATGRRTKCAARRCTAAAPATLLRLNPHRGWRTDIRICPASGGAARMSVVEGFRGGARGTPTVAYTSLYQPWAAEKAKTLGDKDDPTLRCIPTAFGTLNVSLYGVGAVGQIISTPKFVVMLPETFHGYRLIPTDGRPHRDDVPPAYRGDSVGHWEGDTFVVDTTNYTDNTWMFAEGRVPSIPMRCISSSDTAAWIRTPGNRSHNRRSKGAHSAMERSESNAGARAFRQIMSLACTGWKLNR